MSDDLTDQVNRAVIAIVAMLVVFAALAFILVIWGASDGAIGRVEDFAGYLRDHDHRDAKLVATLGALVIALLMATVLILELTPSPVQRMRVREIKSGDATLTTAEIAGRLDEEVARIDHVAACESVVAARGNHRVEVVLDLQVRPGADLAATADAACGRAQELVEREMGIALAARPRARMHYRELRLKDGAPAAPSTGWERPASDEGAR
jgi:hypothetical protein